MRPESGFKNTSNALLDGRCSYRLDGAADNNLLFRLFAKLCSFVTEVQIETFKYFPCAFALHAACDYVINFANQQGLISIISSI
jgi:hypothetical protein